MYKIWVYLSGLLLSVYLGTTYLVSYWKFFAKNVLKYTYTLRNFEKEKRSDVLKIYT